MQILTRSTLLTALTRVSFWLIAKKLTTITNSLPENLLKANSHKGSFWLIAKKLTTITNSLPENLLKANSHKGSFWLIAKKLTTATMASCKKHSKKLKEPLIKARRAFNSGSSHFLKLP